MVPGTSSLKLNLSEEVSYIKNRKPARSIRERCLRFFAEGLVGLLGLVVFQLRDRLAAGEAGVQFVPVFDGRFAEFPAEADLAALVAADEIDKANREVFEFTADVVQLIDVLLHPVGFMFQVFLDDLLLLGGQALGELFLQGGGACVGAHDVFDDPADQREGLVRL